MIGCKTKMLSWSWTQAGLRDTFSTWLFVEMIGKQMD
jgi:hypothetical protein